MIRSNICINAHPVGCAQDTLNQIEYALSSKSKRGIKSAAEGTYAPQNALILGCSTGYGLASRIVASFEFGANTVGVSFEKQPTRTKGGTPGWYNNLAFEREAEKNALRAVTFNADAFSDECRKTVIAEANKQGIKFDLIIYSLASPVRTDPETKTQYRSVIKPIGKAYGGAALDMMSGEISYMEAEPATEDEIAHTVKVMGGEDWKRWIDQLSEAGVLTGDCKTVAYSYIGPNLSHAIYRDGTIGEAKKDLEASARQIDAKLKQSGGAAYVSVNKGLVTRSSAVIPIIALYMSCLFKVMKQKGTHEGCVEQIERLFCERLYTKDKVVPVDGEGRIRIDDLELDADTQAQVEKLMSQVNGENVASITDLEGLRHDFLMVNGFDVPGVDYNKDVAQMDTID